MLILFKYPIYLMGYDYCTVFGIQIDSTDVNVSPFIY